MDQETPGHQILQVEAARAFQSLTTMHTLHTAHYGFTGFFFSLLDLSVESSVKFI